MIPYFTLWCKDCKQHCIAEDGNNLDILTHPATGCHEDGNRWNVGIDPEGIVRVSRLPK